MRIWGDLPKVLGVYNRQRSVRKANNTKILNGKKDKLSISDRAKDFQTVLKVLRDVPDIRQDKVNEISEKIKKGEYKVSTQDISAKIIQKMMKNRG